MTSPSYLNFIEGLVATGHTCLSEDLGVRNLVLTLHCHQFSEAAYAKVTDFLRKAVTCRPSLRCIDKG